MNDNGTKLLLFGIFLALVFIAFKPVPQFAMTSPGTSVQVESGEIVIPLGDNKILVADNKMNSGMRGALLVFKYNDKTNKFDLIGADNYADVFRNPQKYPQISAALTPNQTVEGSPITTQILFEKKMIPIPKESKLVDYTLEFSGKWKGSILPEYKLLLEKNGWKFENAMGSKLFYMKDINGSPVVISILPQEKGGPEESKATTILEFSLKKY